MARETTTILTNMCMICNGEYILVQDRTKGNYTGVVFPGGHIEEDETLTDAVIREVLEETGLRIQEPKLCGIYDWMTETKARYLVFIYQAENFSGTLKASEEGAVRWVLKEEFLKEPLAHGMDKVFEIAVGGRYTECFCRADKQEILS